VGVRWWPVFSLIFFFSAGLAEHSRTGGFQCDSKLLFNLELRNSRRMGLLANQVLETFGCLGLPAGGFFSCSGCGVWCSIGLSSGGSG